ncbi:MAG: hypothetical protein QM632_01050 [Micrococcaceae bacterium]
MQTVKSQELTRPESTGRTSGFGRTLVFIYAIFAIAATARGVFQLLTKFHEAPLAYFLSLFSGIVYIIATIALAQKGQVWEKVAIVTLCVELAGVLLIGFASILDSKAFPHDTVWSKFGMGYLFIPLFLPIIGLWWLNKNKTNEIVQHEDF